MNMLVVILALFFPIAIATICVTLGIRFRRINNSKQILAIFGSALLISFLALILFLTH